MKANRYLVVAVLGGLLCLCAWLTPQDYVVPLREDVDSLVEAIRKQMDKYPHAAEAVIAYPNESSGIYLCDMTFEVAEATFGAGELDRVLWSALEMWGRWNSFEHRGVYVYKGAGRGGITFGSDGVYCFVDVHSYKRGESVVVLCAVRMALR